MRRGRRGLRRTAQGGVANCRAPLRRVDHPGAVGPVGSARARGSTVGISRARIGQSARPAGPPEELGGTLSHALAVRLHITRGEAARRSWPRPPIWGHAARSPANRCHRCCRHRGRTARGAIGGDHVAVIRQFFNNCRRVDVETREHAEQQLANMPLRSAPTSSQTGRPTRRLPQPGWHLHRYDRARRRGLSLGNQDPDGMSSSAGGSPPKPAPPSRRYWPNWPRPACAIPGTTHPPSTATRRGGPAPARLPLSKPAQPRRIQAALRAILASGELGQHNGLPATIIVTTTLKQLESATGEGLTGGGTQFPLSDVIRLARHAHHYLVIFDDAKADRAVPRQTTRVAGSTHRAPRARPWVHTSGLRRAGLLVRGPPSDPYTKCRATDINDLASAAEAITRWLKQGWTTRKRKTATPNGSRRPILGLTANPEPTASTTPKNFWWSKTTRSLNGLLGRRPEEDQQLADGPGEPSPTDSKQTRPTGRASCARRSPSPG